MRSLVFTALLTVAATACVHTPETPEKKIASAADYYPLAVGTSWTYEVNLLGEKRHLDIKMTRADSSGFVEDSTGAQLTSDSFGVRDQKRYLLRNPVEAGTKCTNVVSVSSVEHYEIIAADQPCDAPAGAFTGCVIVQSTNRIEEGKVLVNEMTFAPGVGIVKLSTVLESNGQRTPQSALLLTKYVSAKAPAPAPGARKP